MHDTNVGLGHDRQIVFQQVIVIFVNGAVKSVLDGDDGSLHGARCKRSKDVIEARAWNHLCLGAQKLENGLFAEGSPLALKCNSLDTTLLHGAARAHSIVWCL